MKSVKLPDGQTVRFPSDMSASDIAAELNKTAAPAPSGTMIDDLNREYAESRSPVDDMVSTLNQEYSDWGVPPEPKLPKYTEMSPEEQQLHREVEFIRLRQPEIQKQAKDNRLAKVKDLATPRGTVDQIADFFSAMDPSHVKDDRSFGTGEIGRQRGELAERVIDKNLSNEERGQALRALQSMGNRGAKSYSGGFWSTISQDFDPTKVAPFVSGWMEAKDAVDGAMTVAALNSDKPLSVNQLQIVNEMEDELRNEEEFKKNSSMGLRMSKGAFNILSVLPAYAGEFAATGGIGKASSIAGQKAARKALRSAVGRRIKNRTVRGMVRRATGEGAASILQGTAQGVFAGRMLANSANQMQQNPEMGMGEAAYKGWLDSVIETYSERFGRTLGRGTKALSRSQAAKKAESYLRSITGGRIARAAMGAGGLMMKGGIKGTGLDDAFSEVMEERVGDILRKMTGVNDDLGMIGKGAEVFAEMTKPEPDYDTLQEAFMEAAEQLGAETLAFMVPGSIGGGINGLAQAVGKVRKELDDRSRKKKFEEFVGEIPDFDGEVDRYIVGRMMQDDAAEGEAPELPEQGPAAATRQSPLGEQQPGSEQVAYSSPDGLEIRSQEMPDGSTRTYVVDTETGQEFSERIAETPEQAEAQLREATELLQAMDAEEAEPETGALPPPVVEEAPVEPDVEEVAEEPVEAPVEEPASGGDPEQELLDAEMQKLVDAELGIEPEEKPKYGTSDEINRPEVGNHFAEQFREGKSYKSINEARKEAKELVGESLGARGRKQLEEAIEMGLVAEARRIVREGGKPEETFDRLVDLYNRQPRLATKTSTQMKKQQYSTPAPLAWAASVMAGVELDKPAYDSSAGNGMLLIGSDKPIGNELDEGRHQNLKDLKVRAINKDAVDFKLKTPVSHVVINPPFGKNPEGGMYEKGGAKLSEIDHAITLQTLEQMTPDGKAVIILGSKGFEAGEPMEDKSRAKSYLRRGQKPFYEALYGNYNVVDHFTVHGDLYQRQGASFPVDVIVVDGVRPSERPLPHQFKRGGLPPVINTWEELRGKILETPGGAGSTGETGGANTESTGVVPSDAESSPSDAGNVEQPVGDGAGVDRQDRPDSSQEELVRGDADTGVPSDSGSSVGKRKRRPVKKRKPRKPRRDSDGPSDVGSRGKSKVGTAADKAIQEGNDLAKQLFEEWQKSQSQVNMGVDPKLMGLAAKMAAAYAKGGILKFAEFVEQVATQLPRDMVKQMAPYLESAWKAAGKRVDGLDAPGKVADVLVEKPQKKKRIDDTQESDYQVTYEGRSGARSLGTLLPVGHAAAVEEALERVENEHGNLDEFVAQELGYTKSDLYEAFGREQIDALAMSIARHKEGLAFITGDQTGVGKGRIAAGMIVYAKRQGLLPIFVTEKPTLFKDIMRDLEDIGQRSEDKLFNAVMTNVATGKDKVVLADGTELGQGDSVRKRRMEELTNSLLEGETPIVDDKEVDALFTTYSQFQTQGNNPARWPARIEQLRRMSPNAIFILDESHNAAGSGPQRPPREGEPPKISRSDRVRGWIGDSAGVYFSSATFAKRADVMDLYAKTGILAAVDGNVGRLRELMMKGGVPLQQIISQMLVESGMMIRRERSYEGIDFGQSEAAIDLDVADRTAKAFRVINAFDRVMEPIISDLEGDIIDEFGGEVHSDSSTGDAGVTSIAFSSQLWNIVDQMLLAMKADAVADAAIEAKKNGEKVVIYVDSTLEAGLKRYVQKNEIKEGDPVNFRYNDFLEHMLDRSREVTVRLGPEESDKRRFYITDEMINSHPDGENAMRAFNEALQYIREFETTLPASPIDWMRKRISDADLKVSEITGRQNMLDYMEGENGETLSALKRRPSNEEGTRGRNEQIDKFQNGELDVLIINQSGATGISLHASETAGDQKPRRMLIAQPARNIDTFMQSLGRIHRTGQVENPAFTLFMTNSPSEKRPASVLVKKLASLNANVTAGAEGGVSFDTIPDVLNSVGDRVIADYLFENPDLNRELGGLVRLNSDGVPDHAANQDIARKASGYMAMQPIAQQEQFWKEVTELFEEEITNLELANKNPLRSLVLPLDAEVKESVEVFEGNTSAASSFERPAYIQRAEVNVLGEPFSSEEVKGQVDAGLDGKTPQEWHRDFMETYVEDSKQYVEDQIRKRLDSLPEDATDTQRQEEENTLRARFRRQFAATRDAISGFVPGSRVTWQPEEGEFVVGVVTELKRRKGTGSPFAPSRYVATISVASQHRRAKLPLSYSMRMEPELTPIGRVATEDDYKQFDEPREAKEQRYIGSGNLVAAYDLFSSEKGKLVFYTDSDGNVQRGVLLPRQFQLSRWESNRPVVFKKGSAANLLSYLRSGGRVTTPGQRSVVVTMDNGSLYIHAPKSKSRNRRWTLNQGVLDAAAPDEFASRGSRSTLEVSDESKHEAVLAAMLEIDPLQANENQEHARQFAASLGAPMELSANRQTESDDAPELSPSGRLKQRKAHTEDTIGADDILRTWEKLFGVPIFTSRTFLRKAAGEYSSAEESIKMLSKNAQSLYVGSHEVGHHVDKMTDATATLKHDLDVARKTGDQATENILSTIMSQLKALDYEPLRGEPKEGFAEIFRMKVMSMGEMDIPPEVSKWFDEALSNDGTMLEAFKKAKEHANRYRDQGFMNEARSVFGGPSQDLEISEAGARERARHWLVTRFDGPEGLYQKIVDKRHSIGRAVGEAREKGLRKHRGGAAASAYELVMAFDGTEGAHASRAIQEGVYTVSAGEQRRLGRGLTDVIKGLTEEEVDEAQSYALARHTLAVKTDYNTGMTRETAEKVVEYTQRDPQRYDKYHRFAQQLTAFNNDLIEMLLDSDVITEADAFRMLDAHGDTYVPLHREMDPRRRKSRSSFAGRGMVNLPKGVRRRSMKGSDLNVRNLLDSTMERAQRFYSLAMRQQVLRALVREMDPHLGGAEGMSHWMTRVPGQRVRDETTIASILGEMVKKGFISEADARASMIRKKRFTDDNMLSEKDLKFLRNRYKLPDDVDEMVVESKLFNEPDAMARVGTWRTEFQVEGDKYMIRVNVGGTPLLYYVDKLLYESLSPDPMANNLLVKGLHSLQQTFKMGAVGLSTGFVGQNLIRDVQSAAINSGRNPMEVFARTARWTAEYIRSKEKNSELIQLFLDYGGHMYSAIGMDRRSLEAARARLLRADKKLFDIESIHDVRQLAERGLELLQDWVAWSDAGPRLAEMEAVLHSFGYIEKDGKLYNQNKDRFEAPPRDIAVKAMNAAQDITYNYRRSGSHTQYAELVMPFLNAAIQGLDKQGRTLKSVVRDYNKNNEAGRRARYRALSLAMLASTGVLSGLFRGDDDEEQDDWLQYGYWTFGSGDSTALKVGISREYAWAPALIEGILTGEPIDAAKYSIGQVFPSPGGPIRTAGEVIFNYDFYRGRAIVPRGMEDRAPEYQYNEYTLELSKLLGKATHLSPMRLEHGLSQMTGGAYRRLAGTAENVLKGEIGTRDIPFVRGFAVNRRQDTSIGEFYNLKRDASYSKDRGEEGADERLNELRIYESWMNRLRDNRSESYDPALNLVALSREALGKPMLASYPHPLYHQELPDAVRADLRKSLIRDVRTVAEGLTRPRLDRGEDPQRYEIALKKWEARREALLVFLSQHRNSPLVRSVANQVARTRSFREQGRTEYAREFAREVLNK